MTVGSEAAMIPSAVPIYNQTTLLPEYAVFPLSTATAAVQKIGIAAMRRNCGATRLAFSSNFANHAFATSWGVPAGSGMAGSGNSFRKRISGSFRISGLSLKCCTALVALWIQMTGRPCSFAKWTMSAVPPNPWLGSPSHNAMSNWLCCTVSMPHS